MGTLREIQGTGATTAAVVEDAWHPSGRPRTARQGRPQAGLLDSVEKVLTAGIALGLELAYGEGMELSIWAEDHTEGLLHPLGRRWQHAQAVADAARKLALWADARGR